MESLRFYEREGLLPKPQRTPSGHRRYGQWAVDRLLLIKRAQSLGFSLPDIAALIEAMDDPKVDCRGVCATHEAKLDHVDRLLAQLLSTGICGFRELWPLISGYSGPFAEGAPV